MFGFLSTKMSPWTRQRPDAALMFATDINMARNLRWLRAGSIAKKTKA
tara:strand:+ start:721 stop:864 length:144 start_codon:yes stop_codon:yes gene_type:complete